MVCDYEIVIIEISTSLYFTDMRERHETDTDIDTEQKQPRSFQ